MKYFLLWATLLTPAYSWAQSGIYTGINGVPFLFGTLDVSAEREVSPFLALRIRGGGRIQGRQQGEVPRIAPLADYIQLKNRGAFLALGARVFDRTSTDYPYIALDIAGVYYSEDIYRESSGGGSRIHHAEDFTLGASLTIGMLSRLSSRFELDLGLQFGFSPARDDLLAYYYPGMGFTTFGFGRYGVKGGHMQPVVGLRYNFVPDKRFRIRRKR